MHSKREPTGGFTNSGEGALWLWQKPEFKEMPLSGQIHREVFFYEIICHSEPGRGPAGVCSFRPHFGLGFKHELP